ncbi:hypothetical protein LJC59_01290 [Desulfovibrio sp. OttesenSCG-928-A18]|nr:hypothetical protein [Desulfovibrio sp. OttesenSCG-928-A18]
MADESTESTVSGDATQNAGGESAQQEQTQDLSGDTLLTRADAGKETDTEQGDKQSAKDVGKEAKEGKDGQGSDKDADDQLSKVPDSPDGYALSFAEGTRVDEALLGDFRSTAHELGLSQAQAQKIAELYAGYVPKAAEQAQKAQQEALLSARKQWEAEITKSPSFAADRGLAQAALRQYGSQELYALLDQTNLGSHPEMFNFIVKVGKALAEPGFKGGAGPRSAKTAAEVLYPDMASR